MKAIFFTLWAAMPAAILAQGSCGFRGEPDCKREGESCAKISCYRNYICDKKTKICIKGVPNGGKCENADECQGFAFCGATTKQCTPYKTQGDKCTNDEECYISQCKDGICKRLGGDAGSFCNNNADCKPGFVCDRFVGTAAPDPNEIKTCSQDTGSKAGQDCNSDADCDSRESGRKATKCQNRVCTFDLTCTAKGLLCFYNSQCCSKDCEFRFDAGSPIPIRQCT